MRKDIFGRIYNDNVTHINDEKSYEKELKKMSEARDFNYKLFNKGKEWFDSGLTLEDASEELRNDQSFKKGYEHGQRLARITDMDKKETGLSR